MLKWLQWVMSRDRLMGVLGSVSASLRLWQPSVRRDPYPLYDRMRKNGPVRMRLFGGWAVGRYAEVERVLTEPTFSTDRGDVALMKAFERAARGKGHFESLIEHNLLMIDGEKHRRLRRLVSRAFTPRRVQALRPRVEALVEELLDRLASRRDIDLVAELAQPVPTFVIAELLGVPAADHELFRRWSDDLVELLDPLSGRNGLEPPIRAAGELGDYMTDLLASRRREPQDDLLTALSRASDGEDALHDDELVALASLLLAAGNETTTNLIGNAVMLLQRHPHERRRLQDDLALLPAAIEECLRMEPPIQFTDRAVARPVEIAGVRLAPGTIVAALLAAANRDPARFPDPQRFDIGRETGGHVAFGLGNHYCLGASLARLEAEVTLGALLSRFPDFSAATQPPAWKSSVVLRGPASLPVRLH